MKKYVNGYITRDTISLFRRDTDGSIIEDTYPAEHVAYYKDVTASMRNDHRVRSVRRDQHGWYQVKFKSGYWDENRPNKWTGKLGMWVQYREEACKEWGLPSYEADVSPLKRLMADGTFDIAKPKRCYFDIETDSRVNIEAARQGEARVLSWAVVDESGAQWSGILREETDDDEARLLREMWLVLADFDQVCAWAGDFFDFPVIKERSKRLGVDSIRRMLWLDQMLCYIRNNTANTASGEEKQSYKLEDVAQHHLKTGKHDVDASKAYEYWRDDPDTLLKYNIQDTDLLRLIEQKTGYIELAQTVAEVCKIFPDSRALKPTQQFDGFMLRFGSREGTHFVTKWYSGEKNTEKFPGAYVMEPRASGITRDVRSADFASLYPSIMITWNISPDAKDPNGQCISPSTGIRTSTTKEGIICKALKSLLALRAEAKKRGDSLASNAYKTVANSGYGVGGTPYSRFYDRELCESVTQNGAWLIKETIKAAESKGWAVIYADTDSCFVTGCPNDDDFNAFITHCNEVLYPALLKDLGCRENYVKLAFDKTYEHIVFTAKKRYAAKVKGKDEPQVRGLEYRRGDINRIASKMQKEAIDMLCAGEFDPRAYIPVIERWRSYVLKSDLSKKEVAITKSIGELEEYKVSLPQVRVALEMKERGEDVSAGAKISYVVMDGKKSPKVVIPADDYVGISDRYYLWDDAIYPATQRLLQAAFPEFDWSKWERSRPKVKVDPRQLSMFDL